MPQKFMRVKAKQRQKIECTNCLINTLLFFNGHNTESPKIHRKHLYQSFSPRFWHRYLPVNYGIFLEKTSPVATYNNSKFIQYVIKAVSLYLVTRQEIWKNLQQRLCFYSYFDLEAVPKNLAIFTGKHLH